jgi:phage FluMu protein Com
MAENFIPLEHKVCPKCGDEMNKTGVPVAIPRYTHEGVRFMRDKSPAISQSDVFPLEMYHCNNCRLVELYAG